VCFAALSDITYIAGSDTIINMVRTSNTHRLAECDTRDDGECCTDTTHRCYIQLHTPGAEKTFIIIYYVFRYSRSGDGVDGGSIYMSVCVCVCRNFGPYVQRVRLLRRDDEVKKTIRNPVSRALAIRKSYYRMFRTRQFHLPDFV